MISGFIVFSDISADTVKDTQVNRAECVTFKEETSQWKGKIFFK